MHSWPFFGWRLAQQKKTGRFCGWQEIQWQIFVSHVFPECVARVPVSLGGLGARLCSPSFAFAVATVGNRRQPSATVGNRPCECRKALHNGECCRKVSRKCVKFSRGFADILAFAEEVPIRVICVAAVILAFAEEVQLRVICVAAVLLVFAQEASLRVICAAAVLLAFAEEVPLRVSYKSASKSVLQECQVGVSYQSVK